jgi:hypothetical protein
MASSIFTGLSFVGCQFGLTEIKIRKKTSILNDKETFLLAKSWIFPIAILWGLI